MGDDNDPPDNMDLSILGESMERERHDYPDNWQYLVEEVKDRDGYSCRNCGASSNSDDVELEVHHIVPNNIGGTHYKSNLATLCRKCHNAAHGRGNPRNVSNNESTPLERKSELERRALDLKKTRLPERKEAIRELADEFGIEALPVLAKVVRSSPPRERELAWKKVKEIVNMEK
jgi:hypothetical protein